MPEHSPECAKCGQSMDVGFLLDRAHGGQFPAEWIGDEPETSRWMGLKLKGHAHIPITTYRCRSCGFLEFYAIPEAE